MAIPHEEGPRRPLVDLGQVRVSLQPDEMVLPSSSIELDVDGGIDLDATRVPLGVRGVAGEVEISDDRIHVAWKPAEEMSPGRHQVVIDPIVGRNGDLLTRGRKIPFQVVDSPARVPRSVAIESMVRLRIEELDTVRLPVDRRPDGPFVDVFKATDRESGRPVAFAADQDGNEVDIDEIGRELGRRRAEKYGKLHPELHRRLEEAHPDDRVHVAVWLRVDPEVFDEHARLKLTGEEREPPPHARRQREHITRAIRGLAEQLEQRRAEDVRPSRMAPTVRAVLPAEQIRELAEDERVAALFLYDPEGVDDLDDSQDIANSDNVHTLGFDGSGVRVAVFERHPDNTSNLDIEDQFDATPSTSQHSRHVHGIIKNTGSGSPNGHAPDCLLYSANSYDLDALEWAVEDENCRVINQSFHRTAEATDGGLSYDDIYKDWLVLHWPYPFIAQAAGNTGESGANISPATNEYVNHKGYNSLAVGNHNDDASAMSATTVFRNPSSAHGDRELPEISANGTSVTAVGLTMSGTSMASPVVAGVAALLQDTHSSIGIWPEACRAILMAGATRNVVDDTWWQDVSGNVDAEDGAGAINALESHRIAQTRRGPAGGGAQRGWDAGLLKSGDFDRNGLSEFAYRVRVPSGPFWRIGRRHVKVALAWDSEVGESDFPWINPIPIWSILTVDNDLKIFDSNGTQVGYSGSWDNSYELAEFDGVPGETYDIRIRRWSGTDDVWFGIAWTVTGGLLIGDLDWLLRF